MSKKTIMIDVRDADRPEYGGKAVYNLYLTMELLKSDKFKFILVTDTDNSIFANKINNSISIKVIKSKGILWHIKTAYFIKKILPEIFLAQTSFITAFFIRKQRVRTYIFVHDLICFLHTKSHHLKTIVLERFFLPRIINYVAGIFVVSQNTGKDLKKIFPQVSSVKIHKAPCGFLPVNNSTKTFTPPTKQKYILSVSSLIPRKNFHNLIKAYKKSRLYSNYDLIIVGSQSNQSYYKKLLDLARKHSLESQIFFMGFTTNQKLAHLYQKASLFVYPSYYEGFGMPILEAFSAKCPVACSNTSSLPEVAGKAALYFEPDSIESIATAMNQLLANQKLRLDLISQGSKIYKQFSWKKTADQVLKIISS